MNDKTISLGSLCDLVTEQVLPEHSVGLPYVGLEHLAPGEWHLGAHGQASDVQSSKFMFKEGDILYGKLRPYLDKAVLAPFGGICTTELLVLRPKSPADHRFLLGAVHSKDFREFAMTGVTGAHHPRTSWHHINDFEIPAFDPRDRAAIGDLLWTGQNCLAAVRRTHAAVERLKAASMRELFTRGLRGEEQNDSEVGPMPVNWQTSKLGDVATIEYGAQAAVANATDPSLGTLILTNVNISLDGDICLDKRRYFDVPQSARARLILQKGDVLFNWRSGSSSHVGKTAYFDLDGEVTYSSFILRFRVTRDVSPKFLYRYLSHLRSSGFFEGQRNVSSINSVFNASLAAAIPIRYPSSDEQDEITAVMDAIDQKLRVHRQKSRALRQVFESLLTDLMAGSIRITDLGPSALSQEATEAAI